MRRNDTVRILALLICILIIPVHTTLLEQDTVIEFLLQKVKELEKNQQECSTYQSKMLLELHNVRDKLEESERRISELEAIVYDMRTDGNTQNVNCTKEDDPVDYPANKDVAKVSLEDINISPTPETKAMHSHKSGILRRQRSTNHIAFSAVMGNELASVHENQVVHFDTVLYNEGDGFNSRTGIFTCPLTGTYFFTGSLTARHSYRSEVHLMVDGELKGNMFSGVADSRAQGSISSIVHCKAGKNVWISMYYGSTISGDFYSSFSGFFLWEDDSRSA